DRVLRHHAVAGGKIDQENTHTFTPPTHEPGQATPQLRTADKERSDGARRVSEGRDRRDADGRERGRSEGRTRRTRRRGWRVRASAGAAWPRRTDRRPPGWAPRCDGTGRSSRLWR